MVVHLSAHVVYALRKDSTPLAMFTGRKPTEAAETRIYWLRAVVTARFGGLVWAGLEYF